MVDDAVVDRPISTLLKLGLVLIRSCRGAGDGMSPRSPYLRLWRNLIPELGYALATLPIVSLAKREEEIWVPGRPDPILRRRVRDTPAFHSTRRCGC